MEIEFSTNWNNKLNCKAFTTFRIHNPKYAVGNVYEIILRGRKIGSAECIAIKTMKLGDLDEFIAYQDTGYSKKDFEQIVGKMYPKAAASFQLFDLILLCMTEHDSQMKLL